jgi:hypothetical protein
MNQEIRACFRDMHVFNSTVVATWFTSAADQLEAMEPDQEVSAMLRDLSELLVEPETRPRWMPRVIEGGKQH